MQFNVPQNLKFHRHNRTISSDTKYSKWIRDLFRIGLVKCSEKNRFQNALTVYNVALDSVVFDMFGKSATAITDYMTSDEDFAKAVKKAS